MATFLLVHGGWHGGWAWSKLTPLLEAAGHLVFAPTMTGLGERRHLAHEGITPDLHVKDMVNVIRWNDLEDVILVGHSYGGFIITGVASQMPDRISALAYLDAFVPTESGQSALTIGPANREAELRANLEDGYLVRPTRFDRWTSDEATKDLLRRMTTPHPIRCFTEGVTLTGREAEVTRRLYLWCERNDPSPFGPFYQRYKNNPAWRTVAIDSLHNAMMDAPDAVAAELLTLT